MRARVRQPQEPHQRYLRGGGVTLDLPDRSVEVNGTRVRALNARVHGARAFAAPARRGLHAGATSGGRLGVLLDPGTNVVDVYVRRLRGQGCSDITDGPQRGLLHRERSERAATGPPACQVRSGVGHGQPCPSRRRFRPRLDSCASTIECAIKARARHRHCVRTAPEARKKGSTAAPTHSARIPGPVFATSSAAIVPASRTRISTEPPSGVNFSASRRLSRTSRRGLHPQRG